MINTLQSRPQSRAYQSKIQSTRPITRAFDTQQSQKCFKMAKQHQARNQMQRAQKLYIQATIHNPNSFKAYCNLGACLKLKGQFQQAISAYLKAKQISPKDAITNYNLANVYRIIGNQQEAIKLYQLVISLKQKENIEINSLYMDSYTNLGICFKNVGNYTQAIQCFQVIKKSNSNEREIIFNEASCYLRILRGMYKNKGVNTGGMLLEETHRKTQKLFDQVLQNDKHNEMASLAVIELKFMSSQSNQTLNQCVKQLTQIIENTKTNNSMRQQASKHKAYCLSLLEKYEESAQQYRKAIQAKKAQQYQKLAEQRKVIEEKKTKEDNKLKQEHQKQQKIKRQTQQKQKRQKQLQTAKNNNISNTQPKQMLATTIPTTNQSVKKPQKPVLSLVQVKKAYKVLFSRLVQKISSLLGNNNENPSIQQQSLELIDSLLAQHNVTQKQTSLFISIESPFYERIRKQLTIVAYSVLSEQLAVRNYLKTAYDIYFSYFLAGDNKTKISKDTLFLETHRAIASVLTSLNYSQKAIEHYEIISGEFDQKKIEDKDPLHELHSGLAVNYESQGLYEKAVAEFKKAIDLNPSNYILYYNLGYCQYSAGMHDDAVKNYTKFLQFVQKQTNIDDHTRNSYIFQALISIFICFQGDLNEKISKSVSIQQRFQQQYNNDINQILKIMQSQSLMRFYLKSSDIYEQAIQEELRRNGAKSDPVKIKSHKQRLLSIYISLLELPNCPDRHQILMNCGNIMYEEKQYLSALNFYEKVDKSKYDVYNNIALTFFNINEHSKAVDCMQYAIKRDPTNTIYLLSYEIMTWAYGLEVSTQVSALAKKYSCDCEKQFQSRVQFGKSLIIKFSNFIEFQLYKQKCTGKSTQIRQMTVQDFLKVILSTNQLDSSWKNPQSQQKHKFLSQYMQKHCHQVNHSQLKQFQIESIKQLLKLVASRENQQLNAHYDKLIEKMKQFQNRKDYFSIASQVLSLFVYVNTEIAKGEQLLLEILNKNVNKRTTYEIKLKDEIAESAESYPSKSFSVVYPSIELKLENIIKSFSAWEMQLEDQVGYLYRIIETIAYKNSPKSPISMEYNFPHCKMTQKCERCFKKIYCTLGKAFGLDFKREKSAAKAQSLEEQKKNLKLKVQSVFSADLQRKLVQEQGSKNSLLKINMSKQTLPLELQISFDSFSSCQRFVNELCKEVEQSSIKLDQKSGNQAEIILNKLIRFKCTWSEFDYTGELLQNMISSPLGLRSTSVDFMDADLLKSWNQTQNLKEFLTSIFKTETFLA